MDTPERAAVEFAIKFAENLLVLVDRTVTKAETIINQMAHRHRAEIQQYQTRLNRMQKLIQHIAPDAGYIYVLGYGDGTRYKIGHTVNLANRLKQYQTSHPEAVRFDLTVFTLNRLALEDELKARFAAQRIRGEWYTLTPDDLAYIASLDSLGSLPAAALTSSEPVEAAPQMSQDDQAQRAKKLKKASW